MQLLDPTKLISVPEVCAILDVSRTLYSKLLARGEIKAVYENENTTHGTLRLFNLDEVEELARTRLAAQETALKAKQARAAAELHRRTH